MIALTIVHAVERGHQGVCTIARARHELVIQRAAGGLCDVAGATPHERAVLRRTGVRLVEVDDGRVELVRERHGVQEHGIGSEFVHPMVARARDAFMACDHLQTLVRAEERVREPDAAGSATMRRRMYYVHIQRAIKLYAWARCRQLVRRFGVREYARFGAAQGRQERGRGGVQRAWRHEHQVDRAELQRGG